MSAKTRASAGLADMKAASPRVRAGDGPVLPESRAKIAVGKMSQSRVIPWARIGTAGWANPRDQQLARPADMSHLEYYAGCFTCVEINSSFYRPHRRETFQRWAAATPTNFRFSVKIPRTISHDAALRRCAKELDEFLACVGGLGAKLSVLLLQLPGRAGWDRRVVKRFFATLQERIQIPVVCEPRHPSWACEGVQQLFEELGISMVCAHPVRVPHNWGTSGPIRYYRLHGSPRMYWSSYDERALSALAAEIRKERKIATQLWCIFDNTAGGAAWSNAHALNSKLGEGGSGAARR